MAIAAPGHLNVNESPIWGSRSVDCFEKLEQIGEGTYGQVYMAKEIKTGEIVALKKIRMDNEREGFPITAIREIKILKKLHHENVIKLKEIVTDTGPEKDEQGKPDGNKYKGGIYMVFEYMDHDLTGLADRPGMRFTVPQIKCYMRQLLTGLHYCHVNQVLHRDIKGSNLLIDNEGNLKLADFGLARSFSNDQNANLTNRVITLWYRPPELLLGTTKYGPAVDMWSVGCIFAELLQGKPIFPGKDEPEQLNKIYELCGAPNEVNWPGVSKIPYYNKFMPTRPMKRRLREVFRHFDHHALELLEKMLTLDPAQRITAKDALDAEYFWTDPLPCDPKRQRKSANNNGKMKKWLSVRKFSTHNLTLVFPPFSSLDNMAKCGQDQTNQFMVLNPKLRQDLHIIMGSPGVHLVGQEDILPMGTQVEDTITQIEEVKVVVVMAVDLILLKGGGHLTGPIVCLVAVLVAVVPAAMLELQIIPNKVVHMGAQRLVVART
ncbi:Cyclin-dependent kinase C-2 isoform B [Glycine soja]|uniref:Cyclin-dependent kinase C-2 isoform B n=1 Tax=Glycine soja TaxID=3848 RepID=A0A445H1N5_GLYSO|nr:Cyclin-dependent kinase C-2 isoform B [Glycine soja]